MRCPGRLSFRRRRRSSRSGRTRPRPPAGNGHQGCSRDLDSMPSFLHRWERTHLPQVAFDLADPAFHVPVHAWRRMSPQGRESIFRAPALPALRAGTDSRKSPEPDSRWRGLRMHLRLASVTHCRALTLIEHAHGFLLATTD